MQELVQSTEAKLQTRQPNGLRFRLRNFTQDSHRRLDARMSGFDLTQLAGYRRFLEASAAALLPLESALVRANVSNVIDDWDRRTRSRAIVADLAAIGGHAKPLRFEQRLNGRQVLGVLYVLEGSRLGAKVLIRTLARCPDAANATTYLRHGASEPLWPNLVTLLDSQQFEPACEIDVMRGAELAFNLFAEAAACA